MFRNITNTSDSISGISRMTGTEEGSHGIGTVSIFMTVVRFCLAFFDICRVQLVVSDCVMVVYFLSHTLTLSFAGI